MSLEIARDGRNPEIFWGVRVNFNINDLECRVVSVSGLLFRIQSERRARASRGQTFTLRFRATTASTSFPHANDGLSEKRSSDVY